MYVYQKKRWGVRGKEREKAGVRNCHGNICWTTCAHPRMIYHQNEPIKHGTMRRNSVPLFPFPRYINPRDDWWNERVKGGFSSAHRLFSRLLLNSLIMSERKSRRTSISSVLWAELFNKVATTLRITDVTRTKNTNTNRLSRKTLQEELKPKCDCTSCLLGFWIFTVESGSGWGLWTTCVHTCSVRIWRWEAVRTHRPHRLHTESSAAPMPGR